MRHVFEDFLKLADHKTGIVDMTRQALARRLNVPEETLNLAIDKLESPDPNSRDSDFEGRRIERLDAHRDWGWTILNWKKYSELRNKADVAARQQKFRDKSNPPPKTIEFPDALKTAKVLDKWTVWVDVRRGKGKCKNWELLFNEQITWLSQFSEDKVVEILSTSIRNGWQGLFEQQAKGEQSISPNIRLMEQRRQLEETKARITYILGQRPLAPGSNLALELESKKLVRNRLMRELEKVI